MQLLAQKKLCWGRQGSCLGEFRPSFSAWLLQVPLLCLQKQTTDWQSLLFKQFFTMTLVLDSSKLVTLLVRSTVVNSAVDYSSANAILSTCMAQLVHTHVAQSLREPQFRALGAWIGRLWPFLLLFRFCFLDPLLIAIHH